MTFNWYPQNTKSETYTIRLMVNHRKQRFPYYPGITVDAKNWSLQSKRCKTGSAYPQGASINKLLKALKAKAEQTARDYQTECLDKNKRWTFGEFIERLKEQLDQHLGKVEQDASMQKPLGFIDWFIEACDSGEVVSERTGDPVTEGTIRKYKLVRGHLKRFAGTYHRRLTWYSMDLNFANAYRRWRFSEGKKITTVRKELVTIARFLSAAATLGYNPYQYHTHQNWAPKKHTPKNIFLTFQEVEQLYSLSGLPGYLRKTVDVFVCAVFSGVRYSDFGQILDLDNVQSDHQGFRYFGVDSQKTKYRCNIPVHPIVEKILTRHGGRIQVASGQKMNDYLKEVCALAPWGNDRVFVDDSSGGEVKPVVARKCEQVTTHTARRSFATNMYLAGVPVESIMKITGHTTLEAFYKYIKLDEIGHAKVVAMNPAFIGAFEQTA